MEVKQIVQNCRCQLYFKIPFRSLNLGHFRNCIQTCISYQSMTLYNISAIHAILYNFYLRGTSKYNLIGKKKF